MKTFKIIALGAIVAVGALFTSCGNAVSTTVSLQTEVDSLSYSYGTFVFEEGGMSDQLKQMGIIADTMALSTQYYARIAQETDGAKKIVLQKEMKQVIDSIKQTNQRKLSAFFKGFQEGYAAQDAKEAHIVGQMFGMNTSKGSVDGFVEYVYGEEADMKKHFSKNMFLSGLLSAMNNEALPLNSEGIYFEKVAAKNKMSGAEKEFAHIKEAGEKFLAENKTKEGVVTLPSGVQYKIVKEGTGAIPTLMDRIECHYHGTLIDGTVFDSSIEGGEPIKFGVGQVIPGWIEILQHMPVGSKWQVYIPQEMAYGAQNRGAIQPFSALIFDLELLGIEK